MRKFAWRTWTEWEQAFTGFFGGLDPELVLSAGDIERLMDEHQQSILTSCNLVAIWLMRGHTPSVVKITSDIFSLWVSRINQAAPDDYNSLSHHMALLLIRAVNVLSDHYRVSRLKSISSIATDIRLPQLLVDLRHEATHKDLPSFEVLRRGLSELLLWLYANYWQPQYYQVAREEANSQRLVKFLQNFGKNETSPQSEGERQLLQTKDRTEAKQALEMMVEVVAPNCRELSLEGKRKVLKTLVRQLLNEMDLKLAEPAWSQIRLEFAQGTEFSLSQLKALLKLHIPRSQLFAAVLRALEDSFQEHVVKLVHAVALEQVLKFALSHLNADLEGSLRHALMYRYISKLCKIKLKSVIRSSPGLQKKVNMIHSLRRVSLAAQAIFSTFPAPVHRVALCDVKADSKDYSEVKIEDIMTNLERVRDCPLILKPGTLLEVTYKKETGESNTAEASPPASDTVATIQDMIGLDRVVLKVP